MTKPWNKIREFYARDPQLAMMFELVSSIEVSHYAAGLHGWTSMRDLCIAQTRVEYPYYGPYLRISPLPGNEIEFRYIDTPAKWKQWSRIVNGTEGFGRLESFLKQLHWFG